MFFTTACSRTVATESGREEARKDNKTNGNCTGQDAAGNVRDAAMVDMGVKPITDLVIESRHCAAAFSLQMLKSCTHLDLTFLYILTLRTYSKFVRKNKMLALGVCLPQPGLLERWPQVCRVKITFELLSNNSGFVSTRTIR